MAVWLIMVGVAKAPGFALFTKETGLKLIDHSLPPTIRGTIAPKGVAVPTAGGYLVSRR